MTMDNDVDQDPAEAMRLDGNAVAGTLHDWFGAEMTAAPGQCASCGNVGAMATLLAYTQAPGVVLRCPVCMAVVIRIVETRDASYLDARGAAWLRRPRQSP
jgi:hypothetical protein